MVATRTDVFRQLRAILIGDIMSGRYIKVEWQETLPEGKSEYAPKVAYVPCDLIAEHETKCAYMPEGESKKRAAIAGAFEEHTGVNSVWIISYSPDVFYDAQGNKL